jgi:hypothetical protein
MVVATAICPGRQAGAIHTITMHDNAQIVTGLRLQRLALKQAS